jgi:hypothetical protein
MRGLKACQTKGSTEKNIGTLPILVGGINNVISRLIESAYYIIIN